MNRGKEFELALKMVEDAIDKGVDHIAISGDLVETAETDVVEAFWYRLKALEWTGSDRLTIVPGNHDVFPFSAKKIGMPGRPTTRWKRFCTIVRASRSGKAAQVLVGGQYYPVGKVLATGVVLVAMDSTRTAYAHQLKRWTLDSSGGEFPDHAADAAKTFFDNHRMAAHRVVIMHHYPWEEGVYFGRFSTFPADFVEPRPPVVAAMLREMGCTLVLCGHIHQESGIEKRKLGTVTAFRAGTAGGIDEEQDDNGCRKRIYHVVELNSDGSVRFKKHTFRA